MGEYRSGTSIRHEASSVDKKQDVGIGADIIGTLFSADRIGVPKHAENVVRVRVEQIVYRTTGFRPPPHAN